MSSDKQNMGGCLFKSLMITTIIFIVWTFIVKYSDQAKEKFSSVRTMVESITKTIKYNK